MVIVLLLVSFCASIVGAICGIGGGVIIKPLLDSFAIASVSTISFLSGCTVLAMSCYSVGKSLLAKENLVDLKLATPMALGAAAGGVAGKFLFELLRSAASDPERVGGWQSLCLVLLTLGTLLYTLLQKRIRTLHYQSAAVCVLIGAVLGVMSSFLGIGGGPLNLVVLYYFFSMTTKVAAKNSLYIILISQAASLLTTLLTGSVPEFQPLWLILMVCGGIAGGAAGRLLNKKLSDSAVRILFLLLMAVLICISAANALRFFG